RRRCRTAHAAGYLHRRRPAGQPDPDALHHAGGLPGAGPPAPAPRRPHERHTVALFGFARKLDMMKRGHQAHRTPRLLPRTLLSATALAACALLSACAVGPDYKRPDTEVPQQYKEAGDWKVA